MSIIQNKKTLFTEKNRFLVYTDQLNQTARKILDIVDEEIVEATTQQNAASGESIIATEPGVLSHLVVYGKSVQDGTPKPSVPVPVEVVEPIDGVFGISVNGVVTEIDLQGNALASLPRGVSVLTDGAVDKITISSAGNVTVYKETARVILDGSSDENWSIASNYGNQAVTTIFQSSILKPSTNGRVVPTLSNMFTAASANDVKNGTVGIGVISTGTVVVRKDSQDVTDINAFKTWLSNNPIELIYPLATPQTIDLGYIDLPAFGEGAQVSIMASVIPTIEISWWRNEDIGRGFADVSANFASLFGMIQSLDARVTALESSKGISIVKQPELIESIELDEPIESETEEIEETDEQAALNLEESSEE